MVCNYEYNTCACSALVGLAVSRTPLSQATLAEQYRVRFVMPGTYYVAAQPSSGHLALLAVCVSEGGREQHEVRSHANPRLSYLMLRL